MNTTVYLQAYFVSIACILGTGILGLPVTLYNSGFYPFLVVIVTNFLMQVLVTLITVEILQKANAIQLKYDKAELLPLKEMLDEDTCDELEDQPENGGPVLAGHVILSKQKGIRSPDLHLLGEMFLCYGIRHLFDSIIVLQLMTMCVSYSLAGSQAYGTIFKVKFIYIIPVFTWCLTFLIIFAINIIQPIVSLLTFIKASLFTMAVVMTFIVTTEVVGDVDENFAHITDSFLMSTVAMGGTFLVMPFLFKKIENEASQILRFRLAVIMAIVTCTILNILWCWAVVQIVPQHCSPMVGDNQSSFTCNSLERAKLNGEISTRPLIKIIHHKYPSFNWVATIIQVFIIISITVSYMTLGTALHHTICGIVESCLPDCSLSPKKLDIGKKYTPIFISLILFGIIFTVAMLNPKSFLSMMEIFTSSALNIGNNLLFIMFMRTRNKQNSKVDIPLPLGKKVVALCYTIPPYFVFALGYNIYYSVFMSFSHPETTTSYPTAIPSLHLP